MVQVAEAVAAMIVTPGRSTDGSSYHVMLSGDNGGGPETRETELCQSTATVVQLWQY